MEDISEIKIQFIDEINQHLLFEFKTATVLTFTDSLFFGHLERNQAILNSPIILLDLVERGALA